jgi:glycogen(starch) synthase
VLALPGYAVDVPAIRRAVAAEKRYDVAFMAKLTAGKGVFDFLRTMRTLRRSRPDVRAVVIGSFDDEPSRRRFHRDRERFGLTETVELAGWLTGDEKYRVLSSARVFCCPSISNDTFSQCLLEALACGLPAACYDLPFVGAVYGDTPAVRSVRVRDTTGMAVELGRLLDEPPPRSASLDFADRYASWEAVAAAEIDAYEQAIRLVDRAADPRPARR